MPDDEEVDSPVAEGGSDPGEGEIESAPDQDGPVPDDEEEDEQEDEGEEEGAESSADADASATETSGGRTFSLHGIASAVLGILSVAAIAFGVVTWWGHHHEVDDRTVQNQARRMAANWTSMLVNLNAGNLEAGMARLRGKTVGQFNAEFDTTMQPYRAVLHQIQSRNSGRIESVSIESLHHAAALGAEAPPLQPPPSDATRTDTVIVVATSVFENPDSKPETVHWNLQLGVSDVHGTLLISGLRPL